MCDECGCNVGNDKNIEVNVDIDLNKKNEEIANHNREHLHKKGIQVFNVLGSVGSGKTTLIKHICRKLKGEYRIKVIAGDIATDIDAKRISEEDVPVHQINTGGMCHLDANIIHDALHKIGTDETDLIMIENVGNLICPSFFDLGEDKRIVVTSVTEGPYMIKKHPVMFKGADIVIINKSDLAGAMGVDTYMLESDMREINPDAKVIITSLKNGNGIKNIIDSMQLSGSSTSYITH